MKHFLLYFGAAAKFIIILMIAGFLFTFSERKILPLLILLFLLWFFFIK